MIFTNAFGLPTVFLGWSASFGVAWSIDSGRSRKSGALHLVVPAATLVTSMKLIKIISVRLRESFILYRPIQISADSCRYLADITISHGRGRTLIIIIDFHANDFTNLPFQEDPGTE